MAKVMIRQLDERVATKGLFMGGDHRRRKLEPGEIVEIEDQALLDGMWETGMIDMVPDTVAVTRPLDYENPREAKLCSPTFKPRGPDEELDMQKARAAVERRLLEMSDSPPEADSPEEDDTPEPEPPPKAAKSATRRTRRGARPQAADHGAQAIT